MKLLWNYRAISGAIDGSAIDEVFKNRPSKICEREPLKNLK